MLSDLRARLYAADRTWSAGPATRVSRSSLFSVASASAISVTISVRMRESWLSVITGLMISSVTGLVGDSVGLGMSVVQPARVSTVMVAVMAVNLAWRPRGFLKSGDAPATRAARIGRGGLAGRSRMGPRLRQSNHSTQSRRSDPTPMMLTPISNSGSRTRRMSGMSQVMRIPAGATEAPSDAIRTPTSGGASSATCRLVSFERSVIQLSAPTGLLAVESPARFTNCRLAVWPISFTTTRYSTYGDSPSQARISASRPVAIKTFPSPAMERVTFSL